MWPIFFEGPRGALAQGGAGLPQGVSQHMLTRSAFLTTW